MFLVVWPPGEMASRLTTMSDQEIAGSTPAVVILLHVSLDNVGPQAQTCIKVFTEQSTII